MKLKSAIKDVFDGFRGNMETMEMPKEHFEKSELLSKTYDELKAKLSPELLKLHDHYRNLLEDKYVDEVDFYFVEGFKLGLLIGIECVSD